MSGYTVAVKTRAGWLAQARGALSRLETAGALNIDQGADADYEAFCLLVEAYVALGISVEQHLLDRARMGPVEL